ncbi:cellulose biosynthesis protein BcsQ [Enterobacteriaceae bacterium H20N1]|uniref:Cellulose biosynthesis protein BcsQ n=1 Tax=Dryocola boscaweniae TaxID=2925397 RepID=A0A9X2W8X7_9ENTR|nr:cellulose biosynthesis protein BcsQ [Dryocola boscaweniae]MCT4703328.1 cellulose biosynthesis protein BcsQ [Dryocola boscaweniae]MCT4720496.1 cellulose biosynthesis protein BcsQ [Dryocola boscaweniae]
MAIIGLQGLRGGVGTTSITAALGWSLQQTGESVLVVDASPDNLLRLHFNIDFAHSGGWARALLDKSNWHDKAWSYASHLDILPFGQLTPGERENFSSLEKALGYFSHSLDELKTSGRYQWILVDLPYGHDPLTRQLLSQIDNVLTVVKPDTNCHTRLHQQTLPQSSQILVNYLLVASQLQDDIYQVWLQTQRSMIPVVIHRDEAMAESAALKQPLGEARPGSLAAQELMTLASWCLLNFSQAKQTGAKNAGTEE